MHESRRSRARAFLRVLLSLVAMAVLLVGAVGQASAECPEEPWVEIASSDEGIGGSGLGPGSDGEDPEDGIGGSGFAPDEGESDGIGGSGIYGTVTGFGSLCVNGLRVRYDDSVAVTLDAERSEIADLAVGQVVRVDAETRDGALFASEIGIEHELVGPVTAWAGGELEVMGERVRLGPGALGSEGLVETGTRVAVSGLRRGDGTIVASRIDPARVAGEDLARGASLVRDGSLSIGSVAVDLRDLPEAANARGRAVVRGRWRDSEGFVARRIEASPRFDPRAATVVVEGYASASGERRLRLGEHDFEGEGAVGASFAGGEERVRIRAQRDERGLRLQSLERLDERPLMRSLERGWRGGHPKPPRDSGFRGPPDRPMNPRDSRSIDRPTRPEPQRDRVEPGRGRGRGPGSTGPSNPRPGRGNPNPGGGGRGRGRGR